MYRDNIAVACRCQRYETQVKYFVGKRRIVLECYSLERIWGEKTNECKQSGESHGYQQLQQDCADNPVIGYATWPEHRGRNNSAEGDGNDEPGADQYVQVVRPLIK